MQTRRILTVLAAAGVALAIVACGQGLWGALAFANVALTPAVPWAAPAMALVLAGLYAVLGGIWPARGGAGRRRLLNLHPVSPSVMAWSIAAGGCGVAAAAGLWIVLSQVTPWSANLLPPTRGVPATTLLVLLATGSLAAPLSEEAAFRGYAQGMIARRFPPWTAVLIVSALFALVHLTQGVYAGKLLVYFLAGLTFGAVAKLAGSIVPSIVVHVIADLTFFTLVWPHDAGRRLVSDGGADLWFWIHVGQVVLFAPLSIAAFLGLARAARGGPGAAAAAGGLAAIAGA